MIIISIYSKDFGSNLTYLGGLYVLTNDMAQIDVDHVEAVADGEALLLHILAKFTDKSAVQPLVLEKKVENGIHSIEYIKPRQSLSIQKGYELLHLLASGEWDRHDRPKL